MFTLSSQYRDKCGIYCKAFVNVKERCPNREEALVDPCRVMSKPVFWVIDQVRTNLMTWINIIMTYICIMWYNAISVRTSAMNSPRQPKISFRISWWSVLVANAESCEYVVHSSCVNLCSKISLVPKIYVYIFI